MSKSINTIAVLLMIASFTSAYADQDAANDLSATCSASSTQTESALDSLADDVNEVKCDQIDKQNTCSQVNKVDPDRRKLMLESMGALDEVYKEKGGRLELHKKSYDIVKDFKNDYPEKALLAARLATHYANNQTGKLEKLRNDNKYFQLRGEHNLPMISDYHMYLKTSDNDDKFSQYKENFVDDYLEFGAKFECQNGVEVENGSTMVMVGKDVEKDVGIGSCEQDERKYQALMKNQSGKFDEYFSKFQDEKGLERGISCSKKVQVRKWQTVSYEQRSCAGRFEQLFKDNQWDMDLSSLASDEKYQEFKTCIDKMQADGFKLTNVSISASASQLNNTGAAARQFCKKGFHELSQARANSAKNLLASEFSFPDDSMKTYVNGENGNGSSGACPYEMKNGQEVLKSEFAQGKAERKELDDAKYVKVSVNFEPKTLPAQRTKSCYQAYISCSRVRYKCGEWSHYDNGWSSRQAHKRKELSQAR